MNTSLSAYTHLESFLLFRCLELYGTEPSVFSRISDSLKKTASITADERFESGRLSPDALRNVYLLLLKEEAKGERQEGAPDGDARNGEVRSSRKRKAPSPSPLPTVQEAAQHAHLIPRLAQRLYRTWCTSIVASIREDELQYARLQRQLREIEAGEWDEHIREKAANGKSPSVSRAQSLPKKSPVVPHDQLPTASSPQTGALDGAPTAVAPANSQVLDGPPSHGTEPTKPVAAQNGQAQSDRATRNGTNTPVKKKQPTLEQHPPASTPQPIPGPVSSSQQAQASQPLGPPRYPQPAAANAPFNGSPQHTHRSPYPIQAHPGPHSPVPPQGQTPANIASVGLQNIPHQTQPSVGQGPPSGPQYAPQPVPTYGGSGVPQYGAAPGQPHAFSPLQRQIPAPFPPPASSGSQQSAPHTPQPQQRNFYPPYPGQPSYPPPQQQPHVGQAPPPAPPPQANFMPPPFQVSPQDPARAQQQPPQPSFPQTPIAPRQPPALAPTPTPDQGAPRPAFTSAVHPAVTQVRSGHSTPLGARTPGSATPRSAKTLWKPSPNSAPSTHTDVSRPAVEAISDVGPSSEAKKVQSQEQAQTKGKSTRRAKAKTKGKEQTDDDKEEDKEREHEPATTDELRSYALEPPAPIERKTRRRAAKAASIASSQAGGSMRGRSRSRSVVSHTDTVTADTESVAGSRIKSEPGTDVIEEEESAATPTQPPKTRRRGATISQLPTNKRKRNAREISPTESEEPEQSPGPLEPPRVIAPRHFSRMCNPIMNDIGSHKHASTFTTAVKAKDAEGYYEIIKRPTDLKSIQKAIVAGGKVVAAAASDTPAGSPGGGGGIVELPLTADVMPPKAIVNSAQLEKELMRMFVNAVMFNAGEEGVVEDAREMFANVEQSVSNWRSAERGSTRTDVEETPPVGAGFVDEEVPRETKRRKL